MNNRGSWILLAVAAVAAAFVVVALNGAFAGRSATASAGASGSPVALASAATASAGSSAPATSPASGASASPAASCVLEPRVIATRATAPSTGFPIPVRWTNLGPAGDLFFSLNDVSPEIPLQPAGPVYLRVGLGYFSGGDRIAFTASSNTLTYDPATGKVSGDVATGYGKNSNRATTDAQPSHFEGVLTRPSGGANGLFTGSIAHHARTFAFRLEIAERTIQVATGPGCTATSPTDAPLAP